MTKMKIDSFLYDVGTDHGSVDAAVADIITLTKNAWANGADLVLLPEYCWCNLIQYSTPHLTLPQLASLFWGDIWPKLKAELAVEGKAVILGSVPFNLSATTLRNRSPMLISGKEIFQDKLCLTPWEAHLDGGDEIQVFEFMSAKCVNLICLDSEIPATAELLKGLGDLDVLFVPSATESLMGVERIARCSSARSVELGCAVIVSQLVGGLDNDFVGDNLGQNSLYLPSLTATAEIKRIDERGVKSEKTQSDRFEVNLGLLAEARKNKKTTNPALVKASKSIAVKGI